MGIFHLILLSVLAIHGSKGQDIGIVPMGFPETPDQNIPAFPFSSYELFTITDLLIEITMRPCNFVNRPLMSSIKKFIMDDLTHIHSNEVQHPFFFPSYQNLVNCLGRVDEKYSAFKPLRPDFFPVVPPQKNQGPPRVRRDADSLAPHSNVLAQGGSLYEEDSSTININLSFPNFFVRLHNIMVNVCPIDELPSSKFMMEALNDIVMRLMGDRFTFKAAQMKYFHNTPILDELSACEKETDSPLFQPSQQQPHLTKEDWQLGIGYDQQD